MRKLLLTIGAAALFALSSCTVSYPGFATSNPVGSKVGVAERTIILFFAFGHTNLGIEQAAKNGGITKVATVDTSIAGGLFSVTYKTTVTGE
ncbi:MAG: hypothetical protein PF481_04590 [Bacteroidales bacterium]|jgi:hypothetical protein|nr:hypothetical protein [Bacteroidales bacterium]